jgi:hypothetical protein
MIMIPPATVRQLRSSPSTNIPSTTATTGVTSEINIVFVTSMLCTSQ